MKQEGEIFQPGAPGCWYVENDGIRAKRGHAAPPHAVTPARGSLAFALADSEPAPSRAA
jgi:hypothetical protein